MGDECPGSITSPSTTISLLNRAGAISARARARDDSQGAAWRHRGNLVPDSRLQARRPHGALLRRLPASLLDLSGDSARRRRAQEGAHRLRAQQSDHPVSLRRPGPDAAHNAHREAARCGGDGAHDGEGGETDGIEKTETGSTQETSDEALENRGRSERQTTFSGVPIDFPLPVVSPETPPYFCSS